MKTIVLGLGNPLFGDDGVGATVARKLKSRLAGREVAVEAAVVGGLDVLEMLEGFDRAIIIDAVQTKGGQPGSIYRLEEDQVASDVKGSPHQLDCLAALGLGRRAGLSLPADIIVLAIEAATLAGPSETISKEVCAAIPLCLEMVEREIDRSFCAID
jgi:hydrogenase maturation protease